MSSRGWTGKYCPNCFSKDSMYKGRATEKDKNGYWIFDNVSMACLDCNWKGKYHEMIDSEEEYKNIKRTKLIDKCLEKKIPQN
jgi:hypothetical protein